MHTSLSMSTDTSVRKKELLYSCKSNEVQVLKCTQSIKVKSFLLKDISVSMSVQSKLNLTSY